MTPDIPSPLSPGGPPIGFVWGLPVWRKWNPEAWTQGSKFLGLMACAPSVSTGVELAWFPAPGPTGGTGPAFTSAVYMAPQPGPDCCVSSAGWAGTCQLVPLGDSLRLPCDW